MLAPPEKHDLEKQECAFNVCILLRDKNNGCKPFPSHCFLFTRVSELYSLYAPNSISEFQNFSAAVMFD